MGEKWDTENLNKLKTRAKTIGGLPVGMKFSPEQGRNLQKFMSPISKEIFRILKPGGFYISFSQARLIHRMAVAIEDQGFEIRDMLGWAHAGQPKAQKQEHHVRKKVRSGKLSQADGDTIIASMGGRKTPQLGPCLEPMVLAMKPVEGTFVENWMKYETGLIDTSHSLDGKFPTNLMAVARPNKSEKGEFNTHLTVKPVLLIEHLIRIFSKPGQVILDPFMGSGSHGVAAIKTGRQFIGVEPVPEYFEISQRRLRNASPSIGKDVESVSAE
jgi:site-specific DNA-methyltransferase (adenine-specific)